MEHNILETSRRHLLITFALSAPVLVAVIAVGMYLGTDMHALTTDGSFISDLGAILWSVAASVCFFAALLLRNNQSKDVQQFLFYSALLTTYLLFDDFFRFHELYLPKIFNIDEKVIYLVLAVAAFTLVIKFRQTILRTNYIVMLVSLGFLAISVASDGIIKPVEMVYGILVMMTASSVYLFITNRSLFKEYIVILVTVIVLCVAYIAVVSKIMISEDVFEEGAKWLGISGWCSYYVHTAYQFVVKAYA
jgi:hypothetical protein